MPFLHQAFHRSLEAQRGTRPGGSILKELTDGNTGLIVACYHGFVDTVVVLAECPHVDVNWQDSEGNTALITAAQAGHVTITNYLLNYFPGLDLERRNDFGFTALMKAAMQGRTECIRALMLAGADVLARDSRRGMTSQEWAAFTGRFEAVRVFQRLLERPCAEQFGEKYKPELPLPLEAGPKPPGSKNCLQRLTEFVRSALTSRSRQGLEDGGVMDHMVRMTTSLYNPAVAIVCQTVCPEDPPCVGKRRLAVQEILAARGDPDTQAQERDKAEGTEQPFRTSPAAGVSREETLRASLPSPQLPAAPRRASLLPLQLLRRSSVRPGVVIPKCLPTGSWQHQIPQKYDQKLQSFVISTSGTPETRSCCGEGEKEFMMSVGNWDLWMRSAIPAAPAPLLLHCQWATRSLEFPCLSRVEAVVCETESREVGPDTSPEVDAKLAVSREEPWVPSYHEEKSLKVRRLQSSPPPVWAVLPSMLLPVCVSGGHSRGPGSVDEQDLKEARNTLGQPTIRTPTSPAQESRN
ncbi:ankyrin repeat domain 33B-like protein [Camelus ferus]|nr:ankyrin repeat domain 33B-like protein [Camelus ferus]